MNYLVQTTHLFQKIAVFAFTLSVLFTLFVSTTPFHVEAAPVSAQAQNFTECDVKKLDAQSDKSSTGLTAFFSGCLRSVLQFIVIIALIALVIRIVTLSIGNTLPGANTDGFVEVRKLLGDTVIGILFLAGAALFLSPLNPVFNSVNIFNLPKPGQTSSQSSVSQNASNPTEKPTTEQCEAAAANGQKLPNCS